MFEIILYRRDYNPPIRVTVSESDLQLILKKKGSCCVFLLLRADGSKFHLQSHDVVGVEVVKDTNDFINEIIGDVLCQN